MTSISLAWRFARGGNRRGRVLAIGTVVGIAIGVAVLLGALSVFPALRARDARQARSGWVSSEAVRPNDVLLDVRGISTYDDRTLVVQFVAPIGDAPVPPGLDRVPGPGQIFASPALRAILEGPDRDLLSVRVPGELAGTIEADGLWDPDVLQAYVGAHAGTLRGREVTAVVRFGVPSNDPPLDPGLVAAIIAASIGVLLSVVVFVWTVTRLGSGARESRSATMRLLGVTPGELRALTGVEIGITATLGTLAGYVLFLVSRSIVPWRVLLPGASGLFTSDLNPSLWQTVAVSVLVPVLAIVVAWVALRRVTWEPMKVARRAPARRWSAAFGAATLAVGFASWAVLWVHPTANISALGNRTTESLLLLGWAATPVGVLSQAPWAGMLGAAMARKLGGTGAWLGERRLTFDRRPSARIAVGMVAIVFAGSVSTGLLGLFVSSSLHPVSADGLRDSALIASRPTHDDLSVARSIPGVTGTVELRSVSVRVQGNGFARAVVADCVALASVMDEAPACEPGGVVALDGYDPGEGTPVTIGGRGNDQRTVLHVTGTAPSLDVGLEEADAQLLIDVADLTGGRPAGPHDALIATDGGPNVDESIRETWAARHAYASIFTKEGLEPLGWSHEASIARALGWAAFVAVAVAAASLLVATIGAIEERRRPLAALAAAGVPASTLRSSFLVQAMAPVTAGVILAICCAVAVVQFYAVREHYADTSAGVAPGLRLAGFALLAGLVATLLTLPSIGRSIAPDALRTE